MTENFPSLEKEKDTQCKEVQSVPNKIDPKRTTTRDIILKMAKVKDKERILKAAREKQLVTYKGASIRPLDYQLISQQKQFRPEVMGMKHLR